VIVATTMASFFLNAVFACAIAQSGRPAIRPAAAQARRHFTPILAWGVVIGIPLAFSTTVVTRWGRPWFTVSLGIIVGMMMVCYVAIPARIIGSTRVSQGMTSCGPRWSAGRWVWSCARRPTCSAASDFSCSVQALCWFLGSSCSRWGP
jgi:hypothetical protein